MARPKKSPDVLNCVIKSGEWFAYTILFTVIPVLIILFWCYLLQVDPIVKQELSGKIWIEGVVISFAFALASSAATDYILAGDINTSAFMKELKTQQQKRILVSLSSKFAKWLLIVCFAIVFTGTFFFFMLSYCKVMNLNGAGVVSIHILLLILAIFFTFSIKTLLYLTEK